jgi:Holliday junction resolvasome RuvABC endonuclease subunit
MTSVGLDLNTKYIAYCARTGPMPEMGIIKFQGEGKLEDLAKYRLAHVSHAVKELQRRLKPYGELRVSIEEPYGGLHVRSATQMGIFAGAVYGALEGTGLHIVEFVLPQTWRADLRRELGEEKAIRSKADVLAVLQDRHHGVWAKIQEFPKEQRDDLVDSWGICMARGG